MTDTDATGLFEAGYAVNPGQVEAAGDQYRQVAGNEVSSEALLGMLPWA